MNILKIKVEVPQEKHSKWKYRVALSGREARMSSATTAVSMYRKLENKVEKFFKDRQSQHKTAVHVQDGIYHNEGEWEDKDMTLYAIVCFLEDHLTDRLVRNRLSKFYHGV